MRGTLVLNRHQVDCDVQAVRRRGDGAGIAVWVTPFEKLLGRSEASVDSCWLRVGQAVASIAPIGNRLVDGVQTKVTTSAGAQALQQALGL